MWSRHFSLLDEEPLLHVRSLFWLQVYPVPSVKPGRAAGSPHWKSGLEQAQSTLARLAQWFGQLVRSENPATGPPSCSSKDRISQLPLV